MISKDVDDDNDVYDVNDDYDIYDDYDNLSIDIERLIKDPNELYHSYGYTMLGFLTFTSFVTGKL